MTFRWSKLINHIGMDSEGQISRGHSMVMIDLLVKNPLNVFFLLKQCEGKEEKTSLF